MKFYSEKLNKLYDTAEELQKAEFKAKEAENLEKIKAQRAEEEKKKLAAERKARAAEVDEARKAMVEAKQKYAKALEGFVKDYGTYHTSLTGEDAKRAIPTLFDFFSPYFSDLF